MKPFMAWVLSLQAFVALSLVCVVLLCVPSFSLVSLHTLAPGPTTTSSTSLRPLPLSGNATSPSSSFPPSLSALTTAEMLDEEMCNASEKEAVGIQGSRSSTRKEEDNHNDDEKERMGDPISSSAPSSLSCTLFPSLSKTFHTTGNCGGGCSEGMAVIRVVEEKAEEAIQLNPEEEQGLMIIKENEAEKELHWYPQREENIGGERRTKKKNRGREGGRPRNSRTSSKESTATTDMSSSFLYSSGTSTFAYQSSLWWMHRVAQTPWWRWYEISTLLPATPTSSSSSFPSPSSESPLYEVAVPSLTQGDEKSSTGAHDRTSPSFAAAGAGATQGNTTCVSPILTPLFSNVEERKGRSSSSSLSLPVSPPSSSRILLPLHVLYLRLHLALMEWWGPYEAWLGFTKKEREEGVWGRGGGGGGGGGEGLFPRRDTHAPLSSSSSNTKLSKNTSSKIPETSTSSQVALASFTPGFISTVVIVSLCGFPVVWRLMVSLSQLLIVARRDRYEAERLQRLWRDADEVAEEEEMRMMEDNGNDVEVALRHSPPRAPHEEAENTGEAGESEERDEEEEERRRVNSISPFFSSSSPHYHHQRKNPSTSFLTLPSISPIHYTAEETVAVVHHLALFGTFLFHLVAFVPSMLLESTTLFPISYSTLLFIALLYDVLSDERYSGWTTGPAAAASTATAATTPSSPTMLTLKDLEVDGPPLFRQGNRFFYRRAPHLHTSFQHNHSTSPITTSSNSNRRCRSTTATARNAGRHLLRYLSSFFFVLLFWIPPFLLPLRSTAMLGGRTSSLYIFRALVACTWVLFLLPSSAYLIVPFLFWCATQAIQKSYQAVVIYESISSPPPPPTTTTVPKARPHTDSSITHGSSKNDPGTSTGNEKHRDGSMTNNNRRNTTSNNTLRGGAGGDACGAPGSSSLFRLVGYSVYFDKNALLSRLACYAGTIMWISALVLLVFSYVNAKDYSSTGDSGHEGGHSSASGSYFNAYLDTLGMFTGFSSSSVPAGVNTSSTSLYLPSPPFSLTGAHELQVPSSAWRWRSNLFPTTSIKTMRDSSPSSSNCRRDCFSLPLQLQSLIPNMWLIGEYYSVFPITTILDFIYEHLLSQKRNIVEMNTRRKESSYLHQKEQDEVHNNTSRNGKEDDGSTPRTPSRKEITTTALLASTSNRSNSTGRHVGHRVENDLHALGSRAIHSSSSPSLTNNMFALRDRTLHQLFSMLTCWSVLLALILSIINVTVYRARPVPSVFRNAAQQFRIKVEHIHKTREYWKEHLRRKKNTSPGTNPSSSAPPPFSSSSSFLPSTVLLITREEYILKQYICLLLWLLISLLVVILFMSPRALTGAGGPGRGRGVRETNYGQEWKRAPSMIMTLLFPLLGALVALHGMMKLLQWKWNASFAHRDEDEENRRRNTSKNPHSKALFGKNSPLRQMKGREEKQGEEQKEKEKKKATATEGVGTITSTEGKINPSADDAAASRELKMTLLDAAVQGQSLPTSLWCSPTRIHDRTDGWWMASLLLAVGLSICPFFSDIQIAAFSSFPTSSSDPTQISNMTVTRSSVLPFILEIFWWKGCMMGGVFLWWCVELYYILFPHYYYPHHCPSAPSSEVARGAGAPGLRAPVGRRWCSFFSSPFSFIIEVVPLFLVVVGTVGMWIFSTIWGKGGREENVIATGGGGGIISFGSPLGDSFASSFYPTTGGGGVIRELMNYCIFPAACIFFLAMIRFSYRLWVLCFEPEEMWLDHP